MNAHRSIRSSENEAGAGGMHVFVWTFMKSPQLPSRGSALRPDVRFDGLVVKSWYCADRKSDHFSFLMFFLDYYCL